MGIHLGKHLGKAALRAACLVAFLLVPTAYAAAEDYPADLVFRDSFEEATRFTTDIGAEPFRAPDVAAFEAGTSLTLEGWVFLGGYMRTAWVMGKGTPLPGGAVTLAFYLGIDADTLRFSTNTYTITAPAPLPQRTWVHVAVVRDAANVRLYINGVQVQSQSGTAPIPAAPSVRFGVGSPVGADGEGTRGWEPGMFGRQLRVWSVARSAAQLQAGMSQFHPTDANGLVANWPMDEGGGTVARDVSGFGRALVKSVAIGAARVAVLEDGPHFQRSVHAAPAGLITDPGSLTPIDFDDDGDQDLYLTQIATATFPATERRQLAFRNVGGSFVEATSAVLGNLMLVNARRHWASDFNLDGRTDLLVAETGTDTAPFPGAQSRILIQSSDGRLVDETATRLPQHDSYTHGLAVGDIDSDGDLDIYMGNYIKDVPRLYLNDGSGHFSDAPGRLPADVAAGDSQNPAVAFCDLNRDSHLDVVLGGNYYEPSGEGSNDPNLLLMNNGSGYFIHDPAFTLPPKLHGSAGVTVEIACADLNADGAPELVLATDIKGETPGLQLLLNDGAGHMTDASQQLNLDFPSTDRWVVELTVVDMNSDGKPDLVLRTNPRVTYQEPFSRSILLNRGGAVFVDASEAFIANLAVGVAAADFDRDGRIDLAVPGISSLLLFRNTKDLNLATFGPGPTPACGLDRWSGFVTTGGLGSTLIAGGPEDSAAVPRYSGLCAIKASAPGNYLRDESPTALASFHARFYVLAASTGGTAEIFQARNAAAAPMLTVRYTGTAFEIAGSNGAFTASGPVTANRWYAVELDWTAGGAPTMKVQGAGQMALAPVLASTAPMGDRIDTAVLGWIAGAGTGSFAFDDYASRSGSAPGRLCRGDADGNELRDARDADAARNEFLQQGLARHQPDCNEDGEVNSGDMLCLRNLQAASQGSCAVFPGL